MKYFVYVLKNREDIFYVGSTNNIQDRKYRHLSKRSMAKDCVTENTVFEILESFDTRSEAIAYEMAISCFFRFEGFNLKNKYLGLKYSPETKEKNKGVLKNNKVVSKETAGKISLSKKQLIKNRPELLEILQEENNKRKKKVFRSDGFIYETTEKCMRDLKISGKKFKSLITGGLLYKGFKISFVEIA
jgi:predicted GIY-YIG superfamily endonuclease